MIVGQKVKTLLAPVLQRQILPHRPEIIANMKLAGWLNSRKYSQNNLLNQKCTNIKDKA
jgi:hypothetical protein